MELVLFRHGESQPPEAAENDAERELTEEGKADVQSMGEALLRSGFRPAAILTSPLVRAKQTGDILGKIFGVDAGPDDRLDSGATLGDVQAIAAEKRVDRLLLVGHEPDLGTIVRELTGGRVKMRSGGVARIDADRIEPGAGMLHWLLPPALFLGVRVKS